MEELPVLSEILCHNVIVANKCKNEIQCVCVPENHVIFPVVHFLNSWTVQFVAW